jgi:hypothetical protein
MLALLVIAIAAAIFLVRRSNRRKPSDEPVP